MTLTSRFHRALSWAAELHAGQTRKGTEVPYVSHLLVVAGTVLDHGGGEEEAIAALLHDAAEDRGGYETLAEVEARFGPRVAQMVHDLSDTLEAPKPPWYPRKTSYIERLREADEGTRLVAAADKLHNARAILRDFQAQGDALWKRFSVGAGDSLWYYRTLADLFVEVGPHPIAGELDAVVSALEAEVGPVEPVVARDGVSLVEP